MLDKLAIYLAGNNRNIIDLIKTAIENAESRFPKTESNSHRGYRLSWVKDRANVYMDGKEQWKTNAIIEIMVGHMQIKNKKP